MTTKVRGYGCSSILKAIVLQFKLAGHGLSTRLVRTECGQWVVEAKLKPVVRRTVTTEGPDHARSM